MAKTTSKAGVIILDDGSYAPQTISKDCLTYTVNYKQNAEDITGFGEGSQNFTPGLLVTDVSIDMLWNTLATTGAYTVIKSIMAAQLAGSFAGCTLSVQPESSGLKWVGEVMCEGFTITGSAQGGAILLGTVNFKVFGATAPTIA